VLNLITQGGGSFIISSSANLPITLNANVSYNALPNQTITGTSGITTVIFTEPSSNFTISVSGSTMTMLDKIGSFGTDTLSNVQRILFSDNNAIAMDTSANQHAGAAYLLYEAAFGRTPDLAGLGYWIKALDSGTNLVDGVAANFIASAEFQNLYGGSNPSIDTFITLLYQNVLHRAPDQTGHDYWSAQLQSSNTLHTRAAILEAFASSIENIATITPLIAQGIHYTQYIA
jgi:hypothetical protein